MPLKPALANTVKPDSAGYVMGELSSITELDSSESEYDSEQYLFDFIVQGTIKPVVFKLWTGVKLNSEKSDFSRSKDGDYNRLTRLCLSLGLITPQDLKSLDDDKLTAIGEALDGLVGKKIKFKLIRNLKKNGLGQIDLDSIKLA